MGITDDEFYDARNVALLPMGFCFPGTGRSGDLPPRAECAPAWREEILTHLTGVRVTLVIGSYAQAWHLPDAGGSVTEVVRAWRDHWPDVVPLPHPSPRNNIWLKKNPWFDAELVPALREQIATVLSPP